MLEPLDVIMVGPDVLPLTPYILSELTTATTPFKGVAYVAPKGSLALFGAEGLQAGPTTEPGPTTYKYASLIDQIDNIDKQAAVDIVKEVEGNIELKEKFIANDTYTIIEKIAGKETSSLKDSMDAVVRALDVDRQMTLTDQMGNHLVKQANSKVDYVWETAIDAHEQSEFMTKAAENVGIEKIASAPASSFKVMNSTDSLYVTDNNEWQVFHEEGFIPKTASDAGLEGSIPKAGDTGTWVIGEEASAPFEVLSVEKVAATETANVYSLLDQTGMLYLDKEAGWKLLDNGNFIKTASAFEAEGSSPRVGDYGVWVIGDKATTPFEITSMQKVAGIGNWEINTFNGLSQVNYFPIKGSFEELVPHDLEKNAFYVPGTAKFVKVAATQLLESTVELQKTAENYQNQALVEVTAWNPATLEKVAYHLVREGEPALTPHDMFTDSFYVPANHAQFVKLGQHLSLKDDAMADAANHYVGKDHAGLFYVDGPEFSKYAANHETRNLSADEAK